MHWNCSTAASTSWIDFCRRDARGPHLAGLPAHCPCPANWVSNVNLSKKRVGRGFLVFQKVLIKHFKSILSLYFKENDQDPQLCYISRMTAVSMKRGQIMPASTLTLDFLNKCKIQIQRSFTERVTEWEIEAHLRCSRVCLCPTEDKSACTSSRMPSHKLRNSPWFSKW